MGGYLREWRGDQVMANVRGKVARIMGEFALTIEGAAKGELMPDHGVETGTLRRSIHTAQPGYSWWDDDTEPSESSPERGNKNVLGRIQGNRVQIEVGSGMVYAMRIHQGWGSFTGYHYLTKALEWAKGQLDNIIVRNRV